MRRWFALFLLLTTSAFGWEADLTVDPQIARVGQQVTLTLTIEGARNPPQPDKVNVDGVRSSLFSSRSSSIQVINGDYSQQVKYSCTLMAEKTGEFEIPLSYSYKGKTLRLKTTLKVLEAPQGAAADISEIFFAELVAAQDKAYVHQPVELRLDVFTLQGYRITQNVNLSNMPESGLEELKWQELASIQRVRDNRIYTIRRFRCQTQALTTGTFRFAPEVTVQAVVGRDRFFGAAQTRAIPLSVKPFELEIKPLPTENRPAGFSEGVGTFAFMVENIPDAVVQGDPITVRMRISGAGNLKSIKAPLFASTSGIKTYDGSRTSVDELEAVFEQVLMLTDPGLKELPALTFSWFNPQTEKYESITRGPFPITVKPNGAAAAQVVSEIATAGPRTEILGQDIFYLKPLPQKWHKLDEPFWYTQKRYLGLLPLPALLTAVIGVMLRSLRKRHADPAVRRKRGALKAAQPALKSAGKAARQNDGNRFFQEIWQAISLYFGDKLDLAAGEITESRLLDALQQSRLKPDVLDAFQTLLRRCEQSRYGMQPQTRPEELHTMTATVQAVIKHCERKMK